MENTANLTLGGRILYHRKRLGLTQEQLAERMGVTAQAVSKWEHDLSCPDVTTLPRLADLFGITTDELLGVSRPEEPKKVHVGEIVEDGSADKKDRGWNWEMHMDKGGACFALFLVLTGVLYIVTACLKLDVGFWSLLWPTALFCIGLSSILEHFSAFGGGAMAAGVYFLLVNLKLIPSLITWPLVVGVLLVLWGVSMFLDQTRRRKRKKWGHHVISTGPDGTREEARREYSQSSGYINVDFAFCSDRIHVQAEELKGGDIDMAFGSLVLDLTGCQSVSRNCSLEFDAAFGNLVIQVPSQYRVEIDVDRTGSSIDVSGKPDPDATATIYLKGDCAFGTLKVQYV